MVDITRLFCSIHDFWIKFEPKWNAHCISQQQRKPRRKRSLCPSEVMTIVILFHLLGYRNFKQFYIDHVIPHFSSYFPGLPSYNRFVEIKKEIIFPLYCFLAEHFGQATGVSFIDSTPLTVCHVRRIHNHKVFKKTAKRGRSSTGWFFGFKLLGKGVELITKIRKNMKNRLMSVYDKLMLRKRSIIETIFDQLKNISQIEHSRHRSPMNFLVNLLAGLTAYSLRERKPSIKVQEMPIKFLTA